MNDSKEVLEKYMKSCRTVFWQKVFQLELEYLVDHLKGCHDVLSVGCGPATIEGRLVKYGFSVTGLDVSRDALNRAPDKVRTIAARAEDMSFRKNSFDAVIYVASLQFVDDYRTALQKSAAALRPNGKIIVMLLNPVATFFNEKFRDPSSYVSKIRHTALKHIEGAIAENFDVRTEYFLCVERNEVFKSANEPEAVLSIVLGTKRASL